MFQASWFLFIEHNFIQEVEGSSTKKKKKKQDLKNEFCETDTSDYQGT